MPMHDLHAGAATPDKWCSAGQNIHSAISDGNRISEQGSGNLVEVCSRKRDAVEW